MHKLHELGGQETVGASLASEGRAFTSLTPVAEAVCTDSAQSHAFGRGFSLQLKQHQVQPHWLLSSRTILFSWDTECPLCHKNTLEGGLGHWILFLLADSSGTRAWILNHPVLFLYCLTCLWWLRQPGLSSEYCGSSQGDCCSMP